MLKKVFECVNKYNLFNETKNITVALSGGADSISLLHLLNSIKDTFGFTVDAAHFHHGIRGKEADRDMEFCRRFCEANDIKLHIGKGDVPRFAKENNISIETAAREKRYEFLYSVAVDKIALAHTASDNLETIVFNIARGTSLSGIRGIPPKRDRIIRPLLFCSRNDIECYCNVNKLQFVIDSTNLSDDCSRNKIRHNIIPILKEINPACEENASRLSYLIDEDNNFISDIAKKEFLKRYIDKALNVDGVSDLNDSVLNRVIIYFYENFFNESPDFYHIKEIKRVCLGEISKTSICGNFYAVKQKNYLIFSKCQEKEVDFSVSYDIINREKFENLKKIHELFLNCALDYDKIVGNLRKVNRNSAYKIKLSNSNSTKTLKKLMTEKKVPEYMRKNLPLFADDSGLVWGYRIGTADRVKIDDETKNVLCFKIKIIGENSYGTD